MRELVRNTVDLSLALARNLLVIVLDTSLREHLYLPHATWLFGQKNRDRDSNRSKQSQRGISVPQYRMDMTGRIGTAIVGTVKKSIAVVPRSFYWLLLSHPSQDSWTVVRACMVAPPLWRQLCAR